MKHHRGLHLKKERLAELGAVDLRAVAAAYAVTDPRGIAELVRRLAEDTSQFTTRAGMTCMSPGCG